jgi:hypothetical protein
MLLFGHAWDARNDGRSESGRNSQLGRSRGSPLSLPIGRRGPPSSAKRSSARSNVEKALTSVSGAVSQAAVSSRRVMLAWTRPWCRATHPNDSPLLGDRARVLIGTMQKITDICDRSISYAHRSAHRRRLRDLRSLGVASLSGAAWRAMKAFQRARAPDPCQRPVAGEPKVPIAVARARP